MYLFLALFFDFADAALETNVEIRQPDEFIVGWKYVWPGAARGISQFIQSARTASEPIDQLDHNCITVSRGEQLIVGGNRKEFPSCGVSLK